MSVRPAESSARVSAVASVEPSSTITSCLSIGRASTRAINSAIVAPSLNAGMMKLTVGTVAERIGFARRIAGLG